MLSLFALSDNLCSTATFALKNSDSWIFCWIWDCKTISSWLEYTVWHFLLNGESGLHNGLRLCSCALSLNWKIHCWLGDDWSDIILTRIWAVLRCHPTLVKLCSGRPKDSQLDSLWLGKSSIFLDLIQAFADWWIVWIIDVYVSSWSWIGCLNFLVTISFICLIESNRDCFLNKEFTLNIVSLLFGDWVLAWAWILDVSLLCIGSIDLIWPEICSLCCIGERISYLAGCSVKTWLTCLTRRAYFFLQFVR